MFTLCLLGLLSIMLMGRGVQLREIFFGLELSLPDVFLLFVYLSPLFLMLVVPISCMISVFLTFLRMSTDRELIALKAGGVSLYQMLFAPALFCLLCAVGTLFVSLYGTPWGMAKFRSTLMEIASTRAKIIVQPGVFNQTIPNLTLFARQVAADGSTLYQVFVEDRSDPKTTLTIVAPSGSIATDEARGELLFRLRDGNIYQAREQEISTLGFDEYVVRLNLSLLFKGLDLGEVRPKEMNMEQLRAIKREGRADETKYSVTFLGKAEVELQKRWVFPAACLVLGLFAMPLACSFEGMRRQMGIVLALVMFMAYYSLLSFSMSLAQSRALPAVPAMWAPNALFLLAALIGLRQAARERTLYSALSRWRFIFRLRKKRRAA